MGCRRGDEPKLRLADCPVHGDHLTRNVLKSASEVQKKLQYPGDSKEGLIVDQTNTSDEPMLGDRFHVFSFGITDDINTTSFRFEFDVGWKISSCCRARHDNHHARSTLVQRVSGHDDRWTTASLFPSNWFAEVNEPDLPPTCAQVEPSESEPLSRVRSISRSLQITGSSRSSA